MSEISLFSNHIDLCIPASDSFSFTSSSIKVQQINPKLKQFISKVPLVIQVFAQLFFGLAIGTFLSLLIFDVTSSMNYTIVVPQKCPLSYTQVKYTDIYQLPDSLLRTSRILQTILFMNKPRIYQRTVCLKKEDAVFNLLNQTFGNIYTFPQFLNLNQGQQDYVIMKLYNENQYFNGQIIEKPKVNLTFLILLIPCIPSIWLGIAILFEKESHYLYNRVLETLNNQRIRKMAGFDEKLQKSEVRAWTINPIFRRFEYLVNGEDILLEEGVYKLLADKQK
ncbi:Transmembrane domain-containing protein [Spironucleus salmonicida]|uniref:Transmembrane domain-containing protein n=1 Tax=Spironucleus salmonicida TaxID=348837 RepID=V6LG71_9EUKA|nr:Transmembrane domain-containing protein [Spironucleus salmonicida]|eukprot:EST43288.1 Transmembrane domain-containing protein [Spironucleus salmonicida]